MENKRNHKYPEETFGLSSEKSTRELALEWFNSKSSLEKTRLCDTNTEIIGKIRRYETLTGREIEEIWRKEVGDLKLHKGEIVDKSYPEEFQKAYLKPNQKQFKEFNSELFKAYIDKFSDQDKVSAFEILFNSCRKWDGINNAAPFYISICRAYNAGKKSILNQKSAQDNGNNPDKFFVSSDRYFKQEFGFE